MMIKFSKLWDNFPDKESVKNVCTNKQTNSNKPFDNYCAILLSECFIKSGIDINVFSGAKCWSHSGKKHILKAEDMANTLLSRQPQGFGPRVKVNPGSFQEVLKGKTGVIFFKDYWQRDKEKFEERSGDHRPLE